MYVHLGLVLGRHPKINLFGHNTVLFVVKWRQNVYVSNILGLHLGF